LAVFDASNGDFLRGNEKTPGLNTQPIVTDSKIIAGSSNGVYEFERESLEVSNLYRTKESVVARPVVTPDWIYAGTTDGTVRAFKRGDSDTVWQYNHRSQGGEIRADLAAANGILLVADTSGYYYALG
jgi:outer membrane protein assembly factor BamB